MRRLYLTILAAAALASVSAAPPASDNFEDFRKGLLQQQSAFRDDALACYADFLDSAWEEFSQIKGEKRNPKPKPAAAPAVAERREPDSTPAPAPAPPAAPAPAAGDHGQLRPLTLPARLADAHAFAEHWRKLQANPAAAALADRLGEESRTMGFNDWLTFDHVLRHVDSHYRTAHSTARASLAHYLLTLLGFNARVALCGGEGVILAPSLQTIYGHPYMVMDGQKFYIFADNIPSGASVATCRLPDEARIGKPLDMHLAGPLNLPFEPYDFNLSANGITLRGTVNKNIYPLIYRYPQTDMEVYATSVIDPKLRADLVGQLKTQLAGMPAMEAVNTLLRFTQNAVDYATDETYHGFEKPYFPEEWLYYQRNDCEDRAVFYTYMLWNALGIECQLVTYPGHESAAISLDTPISGAGYTHDGKEFYISDPTYIGASTGQCMPDFVGVTPEIDYHFKK